MRLDHLLSMENMRAYHEVLVFKIVSIREKVGRYRAECQTCCCSIFSDREIGRSSQYGGVAQLGEHLPCKQGVMGSIPIISTRSAVPTAEIDKASANKAPENVD